LKLNYHLDQNAEDHDESEKVRRRMRELIIARKRQLERDTEALSTQYESATFAQRVFGKAYLDGHDGNTSNEGTDRKIHHRVLCAVFRSDFEDHV
jgi:hypothetical protein